MNVYRPHEILWKPPLRQAAIPLCASGRQRSGQQRENWLLTIVKGKTCKAVRAGRKNRNNMNKKTLVAIIFFNFLCLFNSCKCPPERYFDYKSLKVVASQTFIPLNDKLLLRIADDERYYLATNRPYVGFGGYAYATSVCEKGYDGEKFPVVNVRVYSNSDFNEIYLAGSDLIDLIKVYCYRDGKYVFDFFKRFSIGEKINPWNLYIEEKPSISKKHTFTVEFEKSNGEIVSGISQEIVWE